MFTATFCTSPKKCDIKIHVVQPRQSIIADTAIKVKFPGVS